MERINRALVHPRYTFLALPLMLCCATACSQSDSLNGGVLTSKAVGEYSSATCFPFAPDPPGTTHARRWNGEISLKDGTRLIIHGARVPGGAIEVRHIVTGQEYVAANAGDYVYPADVRLNAKSEMLYGKADGLAGGFRRETWLFAYDLRAHQLVTRVQVQAKDLPPECAESNP